MLPQFMAEDIFLLIFLISWSTHCETRSDSVLVLSLISLESVRLVDVKVLVVSVSNFPSISPVTFKGQANA